MGVRFKDICYIAESPLISWKCFKNKTILITGATGLLGHLLTDAFLYRNKKYNDNISVILPVRDVARARQILEEPPMENYIKILESKIEKLELIPYNADYVIHCAAPTQSTFFVSSPVETMDTILLGIRSMLRYVQRCGCESAVWLSSMEVFGQGDKPVMKEEDLGNISLSKTRSSYPQAKRTAELYAYSYNVEYGVPVKTVRLAQTFGPGVSLNDKRVFMQFCSAIRNGKDIVLQTTGETVSNYCYTADAAVGIIKVLLDGQNGESYTLVNDDTSITIREIAEWLIKTYGKSGQRVCFDLHEQGKYAETNQSKFSNEKAKSLGWQPSFSVKDGYARLLQYINESVGERN